MNPINYKIRLDCGKAGSQACVYVKQGDVKSRELSIFLYNGATPYRVAADASVVLRAVKPDGSLIFNDCACDGDAITLLMTAQMLSAAGTVHCELTIYGGNGEVLFSPAFDVYVAAPLLTDGAVVSSGEFSALSAALAEAGTYRMKWSNPSVTAEVGDEPGASLTLGESGVAFAFTLSKGVPGEKGDKGDAGPQGPQGARGEAGPCGPAGPVGPKGDVGTGLDILGTFETLEALQAAVVAPKQGDIYNVGSEAPYTIYLWDTAGTPGWISQGQLQGPRGETGAQGPAGPQGETGPQGPVGPQGEGGPPGPPGETGANGANGATFTPAVSAEGTLTWTNDKALENPAPVSIVGPRGADGAGVAAGGTAGQLYKKASDADYDAAWGTLAPADIGAAPAGHTHAYASKPTALAVSLPAAGWTTNSFGCTQTVSVTGMKGSSLIVVSAHPDNYDAYASARVRCSVQGWGALTFASKKLPTQDLNVNVILLG